MKKIYIFIIIIVLLFITIACKNTKAINNKIINETKEFITINWKLQNLQISFEDYTKKSKSLFKDENIYNTFINNYFNFSIPEKVTEISQKTINKYTDLNYKNYDALNIEVSKVYSNHNEDLKFIFISEEIQPYRIDNLSDYDITYFESGNISIEKRNYCITFISDKRNKWKILSIKGNAYSSELKDELPNTYIKKYTQYLNKDVEYIDNFSLLNY